MQRLLNSWRFPMYVLLHPFEGFWDLKYERKGNLKTAISILILLTIVIILNERYTGFVYNDNNFEYFNSLNEVQNVLIPYALWCIANWSLTTLMDGEGTFQDIVKATSYSLVPFILIYTPLIFLSNFMTNEEYAFYAFFKGLAIAWFIWLLFIGTMTVHQYTVSKTIVTMILTIIGIGVLLFLGVLLFSLIQQMSAFVMTIYQELQLR